MRSALTSVAVVTAVVFGSLVVPSDAGKTKTPKVKVIQVTGKDVSVKPDGGPVHAQAFCPPGYVVTGGGVLNGALDFAYEATTIKGQGWVASYFNPSSSSPFSGAVVAVCAHGTNGVRVVAAMNSPQREAAERDLARRLHR
jgi:hypothetical protein